MAIRLRKNSTQRQFRPVGAHIKNRSDCLPGRISREITALIIPYVHGSNSVVEMACTFCVDSAGRCFDPTQGLGEQDDERDPDDTDPDPSLNEPGGVVFPGSLARLIRIVSSTGSPIVQ